MFGLKKAQKSKAPCKPLVCFPEDFRSDLLEALDLAHENVTSIQLTFDMDNVACAVIAKHLDSGQYEKLLRVIKDHHISEKWDDEVLVEEGNDE